MISQKEMLDIICTEAIEYGGLQEVPAQQHGGSTSFFSPKRAARAPEESNLSHPTSGSPTVVYDLRLIREKDGTLRWEY
jgi:hypothetical protein